MVKTEEVAEVVVEPDFLRCLFSLTLSIRISETDQHKVLYSRVTLPSEHRRGGRIHSQLPLLHSETKLCDRGQ